MKNSSEIIRCIYSLIIPSFKSSIHSNVSSNWKGFKNGDGLSKTTTFDSCTLAMMLLISAKEKTNIDIIFLYWQYIILVVNLIFLILWCIMFNPYSILLILIYLINC